MALALFLVAPPLAHGELAAKGDLFVQFDGGIAPHALPRDSLAPISVRIEGKIKTYAASRVPEVRRIEIALNRGGKLETRGLPVCRRAQLRLVSPPEALAACGPSLVGGGGFTAETEFPDQTSTVFPGDILLFNSALHGHPVTLAYISQREPVPSTRLVVFHIRRTPGTYGTVISGQIPPSLSRNGRLRSIFLQLQRRYAFHGHPRAYLSARCAAPAGFPGAVFPFARASMTFSDGRTLSATLTRSCAVR